MTADYYLSVIYRGAIADKRDQVRAATSELAKLDPNDPYLLLIQAYLSIMRGAYSRAGHYFRRFVSRGRAPFRPNDVIRFLNRIERNRPDDPLLLFLSGYYDRLLGNEAHGVRKLRLFLRTSPCSKFRPLREEASRLIVTEEDIPGVEIEI